MRYNTDLEDTDIKLFPPPPNRPADIQFGLQRLTSLRAKTSKAKVSEHVAHLGGLGRGNSKQHVELEVAARKWNRHSRKDGQGTWTQETILKSFITLRCSPTFSSRVLDISVGDASVGLLREADQCVLVCRVRQGEVSWHW